MTEMRQHTDTALLFFKKHEILAYTTPAHICTQSRVDLFRSIPLNKVTPNNTLLIKSRDVKLYTSLRSK
jgi:hypothetical protein